MIKHITLAPNEMMAAIDQRLPRGFDISTVGGGFFILHKASEMRLVAYIDADDASAENVPFEAAGTVEAMAHNLDNVNIHNLVVRMFDSDIVVSTSAMWSVQDRSVAYAMCVMAVRICASMLELELPEEAHVERMQGA